MTWAVRQLALQYPSSPLNTGPLLLYLTARDPTLGQAAITNLTTADPALLSAKALSTSGGLTTIHFHPLDITSPTSIASFTTFLKETHPSGIDFLINNAGTALNGFNADVVKATIACNYHGTFNLTRALFPLLCKPEGGRVVNVGSSAGLLSSFSPIIQEKFHSAKMVDDVTALMDEFTSAVELGTHEKEGWRSNSYGVSKAGVAQGTMRLAKEVEEANRQQGKEKGNVLINVCCPGWVVTDMTKGRGTKTPDEGAQTPVMLAIGDIGGQSGGFWRDGKVSWTA